MSAMETFAKKKLEIIVEQPVLGRVLDLLDQLAVTGYTVVPAMAGRGREGSWRDEGAITDTGQMVVVMCLLDESRIQAVLEPVYKVVRRQIGIVAISDVQVIRRDHF